MSERGGFVETTVGLLGIGAVAWVGIWGVKQATDMPDRIVDRVFSGSDRSEEVAEENPPAVPTTVPDRITPPLALVDCNFVELMDLDYEQEELAATVSRRNDPAQGAHVVCPGQAESGIGQPAEIDGPMAAYGECFTVEPLWTPLVEAPTGEFAAACFPPRQPQPQP